MRAKVNGAVQKWKDPPFGKAAICLPSFQGVCHSCTRALIKKHTYVLDCAAAVNKSSCLFGVFN